MPRAKNGTRTLAPMKCKTCGRIRQMKPYLARQRQYCSLKCRRGGGREKGSRNSNIQAVEIACQRCGKVERVNKSISGKRKFCSAECADTRFKSGPPKPLRLPLVANAIPSKQHLYQMVHVQRDTRQEIADKFGVASRTVWKWCSDYGIESAGRARPVCAEKLRHLYFDLDFSIAAIARLYEVGSAVITRLCVEYGMNRKVAGWTGIKYVGDDGHSLRSLYEQRVCNWLSAHSVEHSCEPRLLQTNYRADFLAKGYYIEIWGVTGNEIYSARKQKKLALYAANNLPLIDISHSRFSRNTWEKPLAVLLEPAALSA